MASCAPETSCVPGGLSQQKSIFATLAGSADGNLLSHKPIAVRRVLVAMPLRSLNSTVGSIESVITEPGWCFDTNG
jgi:hypothetical protein